MFVPARDAGKGLLRSVARELRDILQWSKRPLG